MNVLILSQDTKKLDFLGKIIESQEFAYHSLEVEDGIQEDINLNSADIIVADFEEKDFGSMNLVNRILASDIDFYPYVIFITAPGGEGSIIDTLGPIPGDFLVGPVKEQELLARLAIAERSIALQTNLRNNDGFSDDLAIYDPLTGILNRQAVYERALAEFTRSQREGSQLGFGMLSINNIEELFENHGKEVRDQALKFVARALRANVRIYDHVGRWIGEKFILLLPGVSFEQLPPIFERLRMAITTILILLPDDNRVQLDIRIGYTSSAKDGSVPLYNLIEQANLALDAAQKTESQKVQVFSE